MEAPRRDESPTINASDPMSTVLEQVRMALRGLKYGHVSLIVQDGRVVQVDRFEKTRLAKPSES